MTIQRCKEYVEEKKITKNVNSEAINVIVSYDMLQWINETHHAYGQEEKKRQSPKIKARIQKELISAKEN